MHKQTRATTLLLPDLVATRFGDGARLVATRFGDGARLGGGGDANTSSFPALLRVLGGDFITSRERLSSTFNWVFLVYSSITFTCRIDLINDK